MTRTIDLEDLVISFIVIDLAIDAAVRREQRERGDQCWAMQGPETQCVSWSGYTGGVIIPHAKTTPGGNERTSPT